MTNLLYVECSPRKQRSASIEVSQSFLRAYKERHPGSTVQRMNLWDTHLPEFDEEALAAKYTGLSGQVRTPSQKEAWHRIEQLAEPFLAADKIVFAVPLWNFSIPYRLKHLIDLISQKDVLFSFDENGFAGRLIGKKAIVIYARGLDYFSNSTSTPQAQYDFQRPYMEMWLNFIGISDIKTIIVEKTLYGPEIDVQARTDAKREAVMIAREL